MKFIFAALFILMTSAARASSNCGQLVYLHYFQKLPINKDRCADKREDLRSLLIDAQKTYELCKTSKNSKSNLETYKELAKKSLYQYVDKEQVDKHCSNSLWEVLGGLDQEAMDPNERDFCLKHVEIKKSVVKNCRNSI